MFWLCLILKDCILKENFSIFNRISRHFNHFGLLFLNCQIPTITLKEQLLRGNKSI